jgi:cell wall-associated NlpC family hydrolase
MADMTAMELAASSAGLSQSGTPLAGRNMFLNQAFGPSAAAPSNTVATDQADAIGAVLARMRTSGSLALSTPRDTAADQSWRSLGMVVGNASFSATDAATASAQIQSPQFQHRAHMLGLGNIHDPTTRSFVGNAAIARRMLHRATGTANPTQERLAAGLQEGGKLRYLLQNTGWDSGTTEQFTGYMSQLVDLQQRGMDWRKADTLLAQASDKSSPQYAKAREELKRHGWTETQLQVEKDTRALDRSGDRAVFEGYIENLKASSKAVEEWTAFVKTFLDLPPVKMILGMGGAVSKFKDNPGALLAYLGGANSTLGWQVPSSLPSATTPPQNLTSGITDLSGGLSGLGGQALFGGNTTHVGQAGASGGTAVPPRVKKDKPKSGDAKKRSQESAGGGVQAAINFAMAQRGEPYVWGGTGPDSWDCSGLMQAAYRSAGKKIRRTTWEQVGDGQPVSRDPKAWKPGDLIFPNPGHVVMWLGGGRYIHAPRKGDVVKISSGTPKAHAVRRMMGGGGNADWTNSKGSDPKAADGNKKKTDNGTSSPRQELSSEPGTDWSSNVNSLGQSYGMTATSGTLGMSEREVLASIFGGAPGGPSGGPGGNSASSPEAQQASDMAGTLIKGGQDVVDALRPFITDEKSKKKTPKGGSPEANKALGRAMAGARGWSGRQWSDLLQLWVKESGWNHKAVNKSSGAAGIPQALPSAHPGVVTPEWMADPQAQIQWGLNYIAGRYRTPSRAWQHSQRTGWYRGGAWNVPEDELATVHQGEMVVPAPEARKIREVLTDTSAGPASGANYSFTFGTNSIQLNVGPGASPATARTTARELFEELQRITRDSAIAKGL